MTENELKQYYHLSIELKQLQTDLFELKNSELYKSPEISDLPKNQIFDDKIASHVAKLVDIQTLIQEKIRQLYELRYKVEVYINSIEDSEMRLIMRLRFIKGYTWGDIGDELNISESGIRKRYKRFFKKCPEIPVSSVI